MKSLLKRTILCLLPAVAAALSLGVPAASPDLGLQNTNLACNDGTNLNLALDKAALMGLSNAVTAMTLYPAGLSCALSPVADPPSSGKGNPQHDYAVGGGQWTAAPCPINFSRSRPTAPRTRRPQPGI
jgi:hypothetical protein